MKCPSCGSLLEAPLPRCPQCKLSVQKLDGQFGFVPAHSRFLSDRSGTLTLPEMEQLRESLRLFHKKFPQTLLSVFVAELPAGTSVADYAFWMANRARFTSADKVGGENYNLLLVIDLSGEAASLTSGYGLEKNVPEETLQRALDDFVTGAERDDLAAGIRACIDSLTRQLREAVSGINAPHRQAVGTGAESW